MLWDLDSSWLMMAVVVVAIMAFLLGLALDNIMGGDGFGPIGNMIVITAGFFLAIIAVNEYGIRLHDLKLAVGIGLGGACFCLATLAAVKAALARF